MKKHLYIFILFVILIELINPYSAAAQSAISINKDQIVSDFPNKLTFQLSASSSSDIQAIKLLYRTNGATCQSSIAQQSLNFTAAPTVDVQWDWDFTLTGVLPPGAEVYWQWEITDASGNKLITDEQSYLVNDPRHKWNLLTSGQVNLQWYEGNNAFGQTLLRIATQSLERMAKNAGISPTGQIWLTIYPTTEELLEVDIHASEWAGGIAYPEYNSTIMAIGEDQLTWAGSVIPHELAHLVTDAVVFNCKGIWLPTWLSEGLAVYAEGEISTDYHDMVIAALDANTLPPLRTLESGFSSVSEAANLAYAQSGMVATYMVDQYGSQKMSDLLASIQSGNLIDKALQAVYGKNTDGIEAEWRISLGYAPQPTQVSANTSRTTVPTLALWTSAAKASVTPTTPGTATPVPPIETPNPSPEPTIAATVTSITPDPTSSKGIKSIYIVGIAIVTVILVAVAIIVLIIISRRKSV
jgi:hypothetical protein